MDAKQEITIDAAALQDIALRGVRRAIAFLGLGLKTLESGPPKSVALASEFAFHWFPDPLPAGLGAEIAVDYEAWLIGSALKELDLFFGLYLDEIWDWLKLVELHASKAPAGYQGDRSFRSNTNVSQKLKLVETALGVTSAWSHYFDGYSLARNCLGHNAGVVRTPRDCNLENKLRLQWRGPDIVLATPEGEKIFNQRSGPSEHVFDADTKVAFRMTEREAIFVAGQAIHLSRFDLSEICLSYQVASEDILKGFVAFLSARGVQEKAAVADIVGGGA